MPFQTEYNFCQPQFMFGGSSSLISDILHEFLELRYGKVTTMTTMSHLPAYLDKLYAVMVILK